MSEVTLISPHRKFTVGEFLFSRQKFVDGRGNEFKDYGRSLNWSKISGVSVRCAEKRCQNTVEGDPQYLRELIAKALFFPFQGEEQNKLYDRKINNLCDGCFSRRKLHRKMYGEKREKRERSSGLSSEAAQKVARCMRLIALTYSIQGVRFSSDSDLERLANDLERFNIEELYDSFGVYAGENFDELPRKILEELEKLNPRKEDRNGRPNFWLSLFNDVVLGRIVIENNLLYYRNREGLSLYKGKKYHVVSNAPVVV